MKAVSEQPVPVGVEYLVESEYLSVLQQLVEYRVARGIGAINCQVLRLELKELQSKSGASKGKHQVVVCLLPTDIRVEVAKVSPPIPRCPRRGILN